MYITTCCVFFTHPSLFTVSSSNKGELTSDPFFVCTQDKTLVMTTVVMTSDS